VHATPWRKIDDAAKKQTLDTLDIMLIRAQDLHDVHEKRIQAEKDAAEAEAAASASTLPPKPSQKPP